MEFLEDRDVLPSSLIDTIHSTVELSTLYSYVNQSTKLFNLFNESEQFTFLAPTNAAFATWLTNQTKPPTLDVIEATLEYHLLNGSFSTIYFTNETQFAPSYLQNASYSNVTIPPGGQRVEYRTDASGQPVFLSNNMTVTEIVTKNIICLGGLMQFVDSILSIPTSVVSLTAEAELGYFTALLGRANFLSVDDVGLIDFVNMASFTPNLTFFVPNSEMALDTFNNVSTGLDAGDLLALFDYHIIPDYVGYSSDLTNGTVLKTVQGDSLTITTYGDDIFVNSAKITTPDYLVVNGVIHVIDTLLDRNNQTIPPQVINTTTTASTYSGLTTGATVGIAVAIPIVVLAALAGLAFWFLRRRKTQKAAELGTGVPRQELGTEPGMKELGGAPAGRELDAREQKKELDAVDPPTELDAPHHERPPVELE